MKNDPLKQYVVLRQSLLAEKSKLETRLDAINRALTSVGKGLPAASLPVLKTKKKMSAAGRARIVAAQKARWAKIKAKITASAKTKVAAKPAVKTGKKMSAAGRARIIAAQKARWAKVKAAKKA